MDLRSLRYFVAVAEELHFSRAAERLHISQPPLSRQIQKLEQVLGSKLLKRTQRRVELTPAGALFYRHAVAILAAVQEAAGEVRRSERGEVGRLVVGFFIGTTYRLLPEILRMFRSQAPNVELVLQEMTIAEVPDALAAGTIDVGFLRPPVSDPILDAQVLLREPFVLAVPAGSRFARQREVELVGLSQEPFVMFPPGQSVLYSQIMGACHKAGFVPKVVQEARHPETLVGLVRSGAGVTLVPSSVRLRGGSGVVFRPVAGPLPQTEIAVAWRRSDDSPLLKAFLNAARLSMTGRKSATGTKPKASPGRPAKPRQDGR